MRKKAQLIILSLTLTISSLVYSPLAFSYWVWSPEAGKFVNPEAEVQGTPQEIYDLAMEAYKKKNLKEAIGQLRLLLKKHPGAQVAPEAQFRLGTLYEEQGDYYRAFRAYRDLLQRYPQSDRLSEAIEREFRIGNLFLSGRRAKLMGLAILPSGTKAIEVFKHIVEAAPYSEYGDKAQFHLGLAHKRANQFEEAIQAFQGLIDQYPTSKLIPQAQFQIADTSYLQTVAATRDQRVMDRASQEINRFLKQYPDTSVSDKAAKLRQEIDEKNAEKNYRIGLFYEKENFLDSAFIYYRDVAERYPHTHWGDGAKEHLQALEKPAEYLKAQEQGVASKKERLLEEIRTAGAADERRKKELEEGLKRLEREEKEIQRSKPVTLKRRQAALKQKERELREKEKALQKKRKHFAKNPSPDLVEAFSRWQDSIEKEKAELVHERMQIKNWGKSLGVRTTPRLAEMIPFAKEAPTPVEQVEQLEAKRIRELAEKKLDLFQEKENLYREYEKLLTVEGVVRQEDSIYSQQRRQLDEWAQEIENLEKRLQARSEFYQKHFGTPSWQAVWRVPRNVVKRSVDVLSPFEGEPRRDWKEESPEELEKLSRQWQEGVENQRKLVDSIAQAFDQELSRQEEARLSKAVAETETDPAALRRAIKQLEREIRSRYNEIQDRNERKNELLENLEKLLKGESESEKAPARGARALSAPFRGSFWLGKSFLFGLPERDVKLTEEAKRVSQRSSDAAQIRSLQQEIELESILIDARNREIEALTRELDVLKAHASLSGATPSRSLLVKLPYVFVREAIVSANRLVPKRDRKERLINQLNQETEKLEKLKIDLKEIEKLLELKGGSPLKLPTPILQTPAAGPAYYTPSLAQVPQSIPDRAALKAEIQSLEKEFELKRETYQFEQERFDKTRWAKISAGRPKARTEKLKDVEKDLLRLIEEEQKIEKEEASLLAEKKEMVDKFLQELPSDLFANDLDLEKQEIESQLREVQKSRTSLDEELRRFRPEALPPS